MSKLNSLKAAKSLSDLAGLLQFTPSGLSFVLFKTADAAKYKTFEIPKRNGGTRTIKAPIDALKVAQRKLSILLQDCGDEIKGATGSKDRIAHGFKRQRSIVTNAREHRNRRFVFNIDLQDFFPSINFGRVRGYFIRNKHFALDESVATVIAQIACHNNSLPQGSPCSPVISNLIAHILDMRLVSLASAAGCTYSRYADDLTFSTNEKVFPPTVAVPSQIDPHIWTPSAGLSSLISYSGFTINPTKTHMQYRTSRQEVTGLVVNKKINVRREYRHAARAMVHRLLQTGSFEAYKTVTQAGTQTIKKGQGSLNQLHGMLGFVDGVDLYNKKLAKGLNDNPKLTGNELIYRRFLIYRNFFAAEMPVILCEGETDNIYLTHAIRGLAADYPELATIKPDGKITLKIRLFKYSKSSTARILALHDGGTSPLSAFIGTYKRETAKFKAPGQKQAIIVLFDNDSGATKIKSAVKDNAKKILTGKEAFTHVTRNLYVVPTPLVNNAVESKIEDFFETSIKSTEIGGKKFSADNNYDITTHYGKKIFAHSVVRPNANSINFDGFRPLLNNIVSTIAAHATNPPSTN
ncbi:MAG TPA: retron Ec67 family RNA-directed DNA polymerase/endonuclease [Edaphobacter sp.]|jgi:RNA-directed DNA polymerase|nr:retron Ec67 family RNA-directed DNA polymerase/endonuclease [Edaphobacter sp.]